MGLKIVKQWLCDTCNINYYIGDVLPNSWDNTNNDIMCPDCYEDQCYFTCNKCHLEVTVLENSLKYLGKCIDSKFYCNECLKNKV